jgi:multiple sugar transport system substrate-binding protein
VRIAVAAASMLALAGCGNGLSGGGAAPASSAANPFSKDVSGTLKSSGFNPGDEVGKSRGDYAASKLGGVTINLDTTNFDPQKFAAQAAAGQAPDLIQVDRNVVATFAAKGLVLPLDQCFALYSVTPNQQYYQSTIDDVTYNGQIYGVPQFFQPSALLANKRVMEKAGVTAADLDTSKPDQVVAAAKKMYAANGDKPTVLGFDPDVPGSASMWFKVFGGQVYNTDGSPTLDNPKNVDALNWMKSVLDAQGGYAKVKSFKDTMDVFGDKNQYVADQVGVQTWAQWYPNVLSNTADKVSIEAIPIKGADGQPMAMAGGTAFAIPKAAKNPSAACAFAINVTSTDAWLAAGKARAEKVAKSKSIATGLMTGSPVADQAVREQYVAKSDNADFAQVIDTYYSVLPNNVTLGSSPVGQQVNQELNNAVIVAMTGEKTTQQALADAQTAAMRAWDQVKK